MNKVANRIVSLGALSAIALAACAPTEPVDPESEARLLASLDTSRACFMQREIRNYSEAPSSTNARELIYLDTGVNETFLLETTGPCPDLFYSNRVALASRSVGSVCTGDLETLVFPQRAGAGDGYCPVRVLGRVPQG